MQAVYCSVVPGCPECERSPSGVCAAHNSSGAFMQGIDGEWVEIEEDGRLDFHGCETVLAEEDRDKPFSSGEVNLEGTRFLDQGYVYAPYIPVVAQSRMGWECPKCHACHAPHVNSCPNCPPQPQFTVYPVIGDPVINPAPYTPYIYPNGNTIYWDSNTVTVGYASTGVGVEAENYVPYVPTEISCDYSDQYE